MLSQVSMNKLEMKDNSEPDYKTLNHIRVRHNDLA